MNENLSTSLYLYTPRDTKRTYPLLGDSDVINHIVKIAVKFTVNKTSA